MSAECSVTLMYRLLILLHHSRNFCGRDDIQNWPEIWEEKSSNIHLDLFDGRLCLCYVCQGIWHCPKADSGRQQSIHPCFNLCIRDCNRCLYLNTDELFQQGFEPIFDVNVGGILIVQRPRLTSITESIPYTM